jgi:hypothetical protein
MANSLPFVKLYIKTLDSSIWVNENSDTCKLWVTLLGMSDKDGYVYAPLVGIASRAHLPLEVCRASMERLQAPDPNSSSDEHAGRRVLKVDSGTWMVLNRRKYWDLRTQEQAEHAAAQAKYAAKTRDASISPDGNDGNDVERERDQDREGDREGDRDLRGGTKTRKSPPLEALEIAQYLYDAIREHTPSFMADAKPATIGSKLEGWARDIATGMRQDGITADGAKLAIDAAHRDPKDSFWHANLLSGRALRKQYENLRIRGQKAARAADPYGHIDMDKFNDEMDKIEGVR